uniref:RWP-RK domain-containing protein n=1 Tax=Kalanchoe fedtschenkoi TaxID=63787 RepID=A0A7N0TX95_KALFE
MAAGGWPEFISGFNDVISKDQALLPFSADFSGFPMLEWDYGLAAHESFLDPLPTKDEGLPMMDHHNTPIHCQSFMDAYALPNLYLSQETKMLTGHVADNNELGAVVWNNQLQHQNLYLQQQEDVVVSDENEIRDVEAPGKKRARKVKEEQIRSSKVLTRKMISQYFYMPITQAAKELNIGLTLLKKRCRELGIRRWPHRKLMSLQTLITNVQELGRDEGEGSDEKLKMAVEVLERERKMMEELPDMQLEDKTKKLRQACFKANYKKRKMVGSGGASNNGGSSAQWNYSFRCGGSRSCTTSLSSSYSGIKYLEDEEDDEMRSLLSDCFSSSDSNSLLF